MLGVAAVSLGTCQLAPSRDPGKRGSGEQGAAALEMSEPAPFCEERESLVRLHLGPAAGTPVAQVEPVFIAFRTHAEAPLVWRAPRPIPEQFCLVARLAAKPSNLKPQHGFPPTPQSPEQVSEPLSCPASFWRHLPSSWLRPHHKDGAGRVFQDHVCHAPKFGALGGRPPLGPDDRDIRPELPDLRQEMVHRMARA